MEVLAPTALERPDDEQIDFAFGSPEHNLVLGNLDHAISSALAQLHSACRVFRAQPFKWEKDFQAFRMPDLAMVCGDVKRSGMYFTATPKWIAEVLSISTEQEDRGEKIRLYASIGVSEYWLVDPIAHKIERYLLDAVVDNPAAVNPAFDIPVALLLKDIVRKGKVHLLTYHDVELDVDAILDISYVR